MCEEYFIMTQSIVFLQCSALNNMLYFCQQLVIIKLAVELYLWFLDVPIINKEESMRVVFFYVFLTMHHSIDLFHLPTLMHNSFIH